MNEQEQTRKTTDDWRFDICGACLDDRCEDANPMIEFCMCCGHEEGDN